MSTCPTFTSSAKAADVPNRKTEAIRNCVTRDIGVASGSGVCLTSLEEVSDRELENDGLLPREGLERDAPLEPEGPDGREPAEPESPALTVGREIEGPDAGVLAVVHGGRTDLAVLIFKVERVAHVGEHDAPDADLVEDGELDLGVHDHVHVSADQEVPQR